MAIVRRNDYVNEKFQWHHRESNPRPSLRCVPAKISPRVKRLGIETKHTPLSSAKIKNKWSYTSIPICLYCVVINQAWGKFLDDEFTLT
jgi:hypothetical protein